MPPIFKVGERVMLEFGFGSPQLGEVIGVSGHKMMTVRLGEGTIGTGDMPLHWTCDNNYELLAGGRVRVVKLA
jgi:hypothetical protein